MLLLDTAKPLAYYDHPFFGKYPAVTENHFGKGTVTYEGTVLSDALQQKLLERVLDHAQLLGSDQKLPAGVRVKHGIGRAGKAFHYYFNFSAAPQQVVYAYAGGTELLSNHPVAKGGALALDPWGVAIVEELP
jgi:beta-galactosidase